MLTNKRLLISIACVALTACALNKPQSMTQSLAQTKTLVPTVQCDEDAPYETLPAYPTAPAVETADTLKAYTTQEFAWAVTASGALRREKEKRAATAQCLSDLRKRGLIN